MTRKTWSTVDVSAYLDGELAPGVRVAFETKILICSIASPRCARLCC